MKKTFRYASAIIALALIGAATPVLALAQQVGDRVRVFISDSTTIGEVTAVSDEGFEIVWDSTLFSFDYQSIEGLERSIGTRRLWLEGIGVGASIPIRAGFGLIMACVEVADGSAAGEIFFFVFCLVPAVGIAVVGAPIGAVVGGVAGFFIHREVWALIPLDDRLGRLNPFLGPQFGPEGRVGLELGIRIRLP